MTKMKKNTHHPSLGGAWPQNPFMTKLVKITPLTLKEFLDRTNDFVNIEYTLKALIGTMTLWSKQEKASRSLDAESHQRMLIEIDIIRRWEVHFFLITRHEVFS